MLSTDLETLSPLENNNSKFKLLRHDIFVADGVR